MVITGMAINLIGIHLRNPSGISLILENLTHCVLFYTIFDAGILKVIAIKLYCVPTCVYSLNNIEYIIGKQQMFIHHCKITLCVSCILLFTQYIQIILALKGRLSIQVE